MKFFITSLLTFLIFFGNLKAQGDLRENNSKNSNKLGFSTGICYDFIPIFWDDNTTPVFSDGALSQYGIGLKANYVLLHSNDVVSISGAAGTHFDFLFSNLGFGTFLRFPIYALFRVGNNATPFNDQVIGLGLGGGLAFNYLLQPYVDGLGRRDRISQTYIAPTTIAEINWKSPRMGNNGLQFYFNPVNARGFLSATAVNPIPIRIGGFGIAIFYSF